MHESHKIWMMVAIFLVIMGLLVGMYLTATPDKVGKVIQKSQTPSNEQVRYEEVTPQEIAGDENLLPDEVKPVDVEEQIKEENAVQAGA